jgi:putative CocE/NonD family hydrolase
VILRALRRMALLPPKRCESWLEDQWVAMPDGVRLCTLHLWPVGLRRVPTVLVRTPYGTRRFPPRHLILSRLLAESGYHVVLQDVRGRYDSEGRFAPFADEARDGGSTVEWIASQSWFDGRLGLVGHSYVGYTAWAALSEADVPVGALVASVTPRDPYAAFYAGGALSLASIFEWGITVGEREDVPPRSVDLERALGFRPLREADRVAFRRVDWWREWVDHPRRDGYWEPLCPTLPEPLPPTLVIAGWHDLFLGPQLEDYRALCAAAGRSGSPAPELVIGPWSHRRVAHRAWWGRGRGLLGSAVRECLRFLDRHLRGEDGSSQAQPVRYFQLASARDAAGWRSAPRWPPPGTRTGALYLRGAADAGGEGRLDPHPAAGGEGRLDWHPAAGDEPADVFVSDPESPVPSVGGPLLGSCPSGVLDQCAVEQRGDVLVYTSEPLTAELDVAGPVRVVLHAASDTRDADFTAKLVAVTPGGAAWNLCEGVTRARWRGLAPEEKEPLWLEPDVPTEIEIDLWAAAYRFRPGERIRLEIAGASFPRFDRNPGTTSDPARACAEDMVARRQRVFHDAERPSRLLLPVSDAGAAGPEEQEGPPETGSGGPTPSEARPS